MSAKVVAQEIVDGIPEAGGEKAGFVGLLLLEIVYYTLGSIVMCYQLDEYRNKKASIEEDGYPTLPDPKDVQHVRRHVRKGARRHNTNCDAWQELLVANAVLTKAQSPEAVRACLADTECAAAAGE